MIIRMTLQYLPAQIVGPVAQFVAVLVWTHWLQPADYGFIALLFALQELAFTLSMSWWTHYTMRYLPGLDDREAYNRSENAVIALAALAQIPIIVAALALTAHPDSGPLMVAALAFTLTRTLTTHLAERARALGDVVSYSIVQIAISLFGMLLGLGLMTIWPGAAAVIAGFAIVQVAVLPVLAVRLGMDLRPSLRLDRRLLRAALAYGAPLMAAGAFGWICLNGIRLVVERLDGIEMVGLLSVGWNLGQRLIGVIATLVAAAAFPLAVRQAAQGGRGAGIAQLSRTAALNVGLMLPATVGLVMVCTPFTQLYVGPEFQAATLTVLPLAALTAAVRHLRMHTADPVFMIVEQPGFLLTLNATEAAATVLLCAGGLYWGGLVGACLGTLAATAGAAIWCFAIARLRHGFAFPVGALLRFCAATAVMALVLRLDVFPEGALGLLARVALGGAVYLALAALFMRDQFTRKVATPPVTLPPDAAH